MTREDAFLADIIAHPADDYYRLVYADWLDGQGREEYGEFIRQGVAGRTHQCVTWNGESRPANGVSVWNTWPGAAAAYSDGLPRGRFEWIYRRGFVSEVICTCDEWLAHGPALVRRQPIEKVVLTTCTPLCHTGLLRRVYTWAGGQNRPTTPYHLPNELFLRIDWDDAEPSDQSHLFYVGWSTESAALDALSKAALLYARQTEPETARA